MMLKSESPVDLSTVDAYISFTIWILVDCPSE